MSLSSQACCSAQPLRAPQLLSLRARAHIQAAVRGRQPALAAGGEGAGTASGRPAGQRQASRPRRDKVEFLVPGHPGRLRAYNVTQRDLTSVLDKLGALGFEVGGDGFSQHLEDLPEDGVVKVVLPSEPAFAIQLRHQQQGFDNSSRGNELEFFAFLRTLATNENPGSRVIMLQTAPFKSPDDTDYIQLDAGIVADRTLYVGEMKRVLSEASVVDLNGKLKKIRLAVTRGASPALAAALQGVTHIKLFLGGEVVRVGLTVEEMAVLAAEEGMSMVLLSGQGLGLVAGAPPTIEL